METNKTFDLGICLENDTMAPAHLRYAPELRYQAEDGIIYISLDLEDTPGNMTYHFTNPNVLYETLRAAKLLILKYDFREVKISRNVFDYLQHLKHGTEFVFSDLLQWSPVNIVKIPDLEINKTEAEAMNWKIEKTLIDASVRGCKAGTADDYLLWSPAQWEARKDRARPSLLRFLREQKKTALDLYTKYVIDWEIHCHFPLIRY